MTNFAIKASAEERLSDGAGLILDKIGDRGKWTWRYSFAKKRREMGLGPYPEVSLSEARKARDRWAILLVQGLDPISERNRIRMSEQAELTKRDPTLAEVAAMTLEARKPSLRGDGERGRWFSPIQTHILPKLGTRRISTLHQTDIAEALRPIWRTKTATAEKCIGRLGMIFRHAKLSGLPADPFTVEAAKYMLGDLQHRETPIPATPWQEIPTVYAALAQRSGASYDCLRWIILTAVRGDAARGALFSEIEGDVWTVPADRVKGREGKVSAFRVPLSQEALRLRDELWENRIDDRLFPSIRLKSKLSAEAIEKSLRAVCKIGKPHGLRTSFRTWVQDHQAATYDVAETALGHIVGGRIERSYARSDLLEQRRMLMERWSQFVTGTERNVLQFPRSIA